MILFCYECEKPLGSVDGWVYVGGHQKRVHWDCVYRLWAIKAPAGIDYGIWVHASDVSRVLTIE